MNNRIDAIYARQSVDKKDSISIESQIEFCKYELKGGNCKEYTDKGYSGKNTDRPKFQELVRDIKRGLIAKVIVYKLDRISRSIGVSDHIGTVHLQKIRFKPKPGLTTAGAANDQHVFVSRIFRVTWAVAHHQAFCLCQNDIVLELRSLKRLNVLGSTPPSRAVLHAVSVFLGVFASQVYGKP